MNDRFSIHSVSQPPAEKSKNALGIVQVVNHVDEEVGRVGRLPFDEGIDLGRLASPAVVPQNEFDLRAEQVVRRLVAFVDHLFDLGRLAVRDGVRPLQVNVVLRRFHRGKIVDTALDLQASRALRHHRDLGRDFLPLGVGGFGRLSRRPVRRRDGLFRRGRLGGVGPFVAGRERQKRKDRAQNEKQGYGSFFHVFLPHNARPKANVFIDRVSGRRDQFSVLGRVYHVFITSSSAACFLVTVSLTCWAM